MNRLTILLTVAAAAYVIGSIPFGLIVGKAKGIDPRTAGSKNIGATNLGRLLGGRYFALVFLLDLLKGLIPVLAAGAILGFHIDNGQDCLLWILAGVAAILGHLFSIFLKFRGGKGVATSAGVILGIYPYFFFPGLFAMTIWLMVFLITRYVSLASIIGSLSFLGLYIVVALLCGWPIEGAQLPLLCLGTAIPLLIVYKHRANIARLRAGTELRFTSKSHAN